MTASILDAYRLPQLVQGWEWGLLRFLRARVTSEPPTRTAKTSAVIWPTCITVLGARCRFAATLSCKDSHAMGQQGSKAFEACLAGGASTVHGCMERVS